jgi:hypothetical protein
VDPAALMGDLMTMMMTTTTRADGDRDGRLRKAAMGECLRLRLRRRRTMDPRDAVDVPVVGVVQDRGDDAGGRRRATGGTLG